MSSLFFAFRPNYSYEEALRFQGILNSEDYTGLLAFEPPETITLGRLGNEDEDLLVSPEFLQKRGIRVLSTDRGGRATTPANDPKNPPMAATAEIPIEDFTTSLKPLRSRSTW